MTRPPDVPRSPAEREIDEELTFHHERTVADLVAAGLSPARAEEEARRRFGSVAGHRSRLVRMELRRQAGARRRAAMGILTMSARSVVRGLRRSPAFTLGVVAILTLGLGVNAITFSLVDRLVLSGPSGVTQPEALRRVIVHRQHRTGSALATTELGYLDYRDLLGVSHLAGAAGETAAPLLLGSGESAERIQARLVTAGYFPLLGVQPAVGRFFTPEESERDGARVAVLSHAFWRRRFGGDPSMIGQTLLIGSHRYLVVGIAPRAFTGSVVTRVDVFLPLEAASDEQVSGPWRTSRNLRWMGAIVRLEPGAADQAASEEATALYRQGYAAQSNPDPNARIELAPLNPFGGPAANNELSIAALVGGVAVLVLLIAFANVANLFLGRSLRQRDRVAVRLALGGVRQRLIAEQAAEGALIALIGAAIAVAVAIFGARPAELVLFPEVLWLDTSVNLRPLLFLASAAILGGAFAGAVPMWQAGRTDVATWLRTGTQRASRTRTQTGMLVVQAALSVLLLVGAGLFVRSLARAQSLDLGIDSSRLLVVSALRGDTPPRTDFRVALRSAVEKIPGVERTAVASGTLPFVSSWAARLTVPDIPDLPRVADGGPYISAVEPGYFETAGTSIVEGRTFTATDRQGAERVAIVNRSLARLYWPGASALGRCIRVGVDATECTRIVGIAENTRRQEIVEGESLLYYVPIEQAEPGLRNGRLIVRAADDNPDTLARISERIRREALALEPSLRYIAARPLDEIVSPQLRAWRLGAGLFTAFGLLALAVAGVGLYSVVAFDVEGRRREIGVRSALGASSSAILRLIVGEGLRLAAFGLVLGLALARLLAPSLAGLLYGVTPQDLAVYAGATLALLLAAMLATVVPGLRAAHIEPSQALRDE